MKRIPWLLYLGIAVVVAHSSSAQQAVRLAHTEQRTITSAQIGQTYELLVSLPADYSGSERRYPVLYVLDGWHFPLLAFMQNNNEFSGRMPPVIIVNISHGDLPWSQVQPIRSRDFTPSRSAHEPGSGGASEDRDAWAAQFSVRVAP